MPETFIEQSLQVCENYYVYDMVNQNVLIQKSIQQYGNYYNYDKVFYINREEEIIITCPNHGDFYVTPKKHYRGEGCKKCIHY